MASGANHSRPTSITYPDGRVVRYAYASGLDDSISRLSSITNSATTYETYAYLGLATVVKRVHISGSSTEIGLTYIKQSGENNGDAGDQYIGLDRFERIVDQRWIKSTDVSNPMDRFQYGYDRDSNRLYKDNLLNNNFDELYHANGASNGYDNFNQITDFRRGALSDANSDGVPDTVTTSSRTQNWNFDALGNWSTLTSDGTAQNRTHNQQNEITSIGSLTTPTYDANGNMTGDQNGLTFVFDAWNRLVQGKNGSTTLVSYGVDALGRRIAETVEGRDFYYSDQWQVLEERVSGTTKVQYVWSPVYVDAMILRDRDADGNSGNGLEERLYAIQDANWNVTAVMNPAGNVQERYAYDPFGQPSILAGDWSSRTSSSYGWVYLHQAGRYETASGLSYFRHRDYSPVLGRWVSTDPLGFDAGDASFYCCVANNPVNSQDPSGLANYEKPLAKGVARVFVEWWPEMGKAEVAVFNKAGTEMAKWVWLASKPDVISTVASHSPKGTPLPGIPAHIMKKISLSLIDHLKTGIRMAGGVMTRGMIPLAIRAGNPAPKPTPKPTALPPSGGTLLANAAKVASWTLAVASTWDMMSGSIGGGIGGGDLPPKPITFEIPIQELGLDNDLQPLEEGTLKGAAAANWKPYWKPESILGPRRP